MLTYNDREITVYDYIFFNGNQVEVVLWNNVVVWRRDTILKVSPFTLSFPASGNLSSRIKIETNNDWIID